MEKVVAPTPPTQGDTVPTSTPGAASTPQPAPNSIAGGHEGTTGQKAAYTPRPNPYTKNPARQTAPPASKTAPSATPEAAAGGSRGRSSGRPLRGVGVYPVRSKSTPPPATIIAKVDSEHADKTIQASMAKGFKQHFSTALTGALAKSMRGQDFHGALASAAKPSLKSLSEKQKADMLRSATEAASTGMAKAVAVPAKSLEKVFMRFGKKRFVVCVCLRPFCSVVCVHFSAHYTYFSGTTPLGGHSTIKCVSWVTQEG